MRSKILLVAILAALPVSACASYGPFGVKGNDTGGIIPYSPAVEPVYKQVAADHCAMHNKIAVITSVHRQYGDYIGFTCHFPRDYDPAKARAYGAWVRTAF